MWWGHFWYTSVWGPDPPPPPGEGLGRKMHTPPPPARVRGRGAEVQRHLDLDFDPDLEHSGQRGRAGSGPGMAVVGPGLCRLGGGEGGEGNRSATPLECARWPHCLGVHYSQGCRKCCVRAQRFFMFFLALGSVTLVSLPAPIL